MIVAGRVPTQQDWLDAHEKVANRICKERAVRLWGRPATRLLTPQQIEEQNKVFKRMIEEANREQRKKQNGNGGNGGSNNRFQLNGEEMLNTARQRFSSAMSGVQNTVRNPSFGPALLSRVNRPIRLAGGATVPRPAFIH